MTRSFHSWLAAASLWLVAAPNEAAAQSSRGEMGPQSRAAITIRVSVRPLFTAVTDPNGADPSQRVKVLSNGGEFHYSLAPVAPAVSTASGAGSSLAAAATRTPRASHGPAGPSNLPEPGTSLLLLIIPD